MHHHEPTIIRVRLRDILIAGLLALALSGVLLALSGCGDIAHWQTRTFYGIDCRPEKLQNGQCVPVKKGSANVTTAQP